MEAKRQARHIAGTITEALGGQGIFGVEIFIKGDQAIFSEVSPRPHDTGMVTMISQNLSEFDLHARAVLGLPIPPIDFYGPAASKAIVVDGNSSSVSFDISEALRTPLSDVRLFGKGELRGHRRLGVCLARGKDVKEALDKVMDMREKVKVEL